ncbi:hypothetical protein B6S44_24920 [Bosea sp. Tri-44]|nr:hypothetical protein B6S44_24920 [Bosea sp. Tri-44]
MAKIVAGIKESGHLYQATFNELHGLGVIQNRWIPQLKTRHLVIVEEAERLLAQQGCGISGPYDGLDEMGGAYYFIDTWDRPFHVLVSMPKVELADAAAQAAKWLGKGGRGVEIDCFKKAGFLWAEMKDPETAEAFIQQFGGALLNPYDADELMMGGDEAISADFIERSKRREACATSTATPAT